MRKEIVISFLLACAVVFGAIWLVSKSLGLKKSTNIFSVPEKILEKKIQGSAPNTYTSHSYTNTTDNQGIFKCMVDGKLIYSDQNCPKGSESKPVVLHESDGFISPPRDNLQELTARRIENERAEERKFKFQQATDSTPSNKIVCNELHRYIDELNAMARQPQSGQMQDWIKQKKMEYQSRQFALHCQ